MLARFLKDRRGGVAPLLALSIVPLMGAVAMSVPAEPFAVAPLFICVFIWVLVLMEPVAGVCVVWAPAVPAAATRARVNNVRFMGCLPP